MRFSNAKKHYNDILVISFSTSLWLVLSQVFNNSPRDKRLLRTIVIFGRFTAALQFPSAKPVEQYFS